MGVERPVTRWYLQRASISNEITALKARLAQMQTEGGVPANKAELEAVEKELADAQGRLRMLGSSPKPMMG